MSGNGSISDALRGVNDAAGINAAYESADKSSVVTVEDTQGIASALDVVARLPAEQRAEPLGHLCMMMQSVDSKEAVNALVQNALPQIEHIFRSTIRESGNDAGDLLMALKILAMYRYKNAVPLIASAVRSGYKSDSWFWTIVLEVFPKDNPMRLDLCEALKSPLPDDFVGVAFLDFCNETAMNESLGPRMKTHPFDSTEGKTRLEHYLTNPNPEEFSYAKSAAVTLAFVGTDRRRGLLNIALDHPDPKVQLEAARASARCGSDAALECLARQCLDLRVCKLACQYMDELGHNDLIPETALGGEFQAAAEMVQWIEAAPFGDGEYPEKIQCLDNRELNWPPTGDRRHLWIYQWEFGPNPWREERVVRIGMTGGRQNHCFCEKVDPTWTIVNIYALHCSWELARDESGSDFTPIQYSIEDGHKHLQLANPGMWPPAA